MRQQGGEGGNGCGGSIDARGDEKRPAGTEAGWTVTVVGGGEAARRLTGCGDGDDGCEAAAARLRLRRLRPRAQLRHDVENPLVVPEVSWCRIFDAVMTDRKRS